MRQRYQCPRCGAPVVLGERFCAGCGINFTWVIEPAQQPVQPVTYENQRSNQQPAMWHAPQYDKQPLLNERYMVDSGAGEQNKNSSEGGASTPISAEISKLLEDFFGKHVKYHKVH